MYEGPRRSVCQTVLATLSMALVVILLSACGIGGDDDDNGTETSEAAETSTVAVETPALSTQSSPTLISSPNDAEGDATPGSGAATPTPAIVVSAPQVTVPTMMPTPVATPVAPGAVGTAIPADANVASGDGTGGAVGAAPAAAPQAEATPSGTPVGGTPVADTLATSCDMPSFPPYSGNQPNQATTIDVNFRAGPGTDCDAIGEPISAGVVAEVVSDPVTREGDDFLWVAVLVDGEQGWLATDFLEPVSE